MDEPTGLSIEVGDAHTSEARLALADALRRLGNGVVARQPDDDLMRRITAQVDDWLGELAAAPPRPHAFHVHDVPSFSGPVPENLGSIVPPNAFPDCVVSGMANPMGIAARLWREEDEAVCQVTLGEAFEGAPGRAHGGIVASIIDETMGLAMSLSQTPAFTGRLTVTYRAPTPVGQPLEVRARLSDRSGRKMTITAELRTEDQLLAEAEGLFIAVTPHDFFRASRETAAVEPTAADGAGAGDATEPNVGEPNVGEAGVGEPNVGEAGVGEPDVGEAGVGEPNVGEAGAAGPEAGVADAAGE